MSTKFSRILEKRDSRRLLLVMLLAMMMVMLLLLAMVLVMLLLTMMMAMLLTIMMSMILQEYVDPRDVKMNELEKVIAQYQDKLNDVTSNYQQKIGMLFFNLVDMDHQNTLDKKFIANTKFQGY